MTIRKEYLADESVVERLMGFNLAMSLYKQLGYIMNFRYDVEEEEILKRVINKILKINSPQLRIVVTEIVCGEVKKAYVLECIKNRRMALDEIQNLLEQYVDEIVQYYEVSKCLLLEVLESKDRAERVDGDYIEGNEHQLFHFPLYRDSKITQKVLNGIIEQYKGMNSIDESIEKLAKDKVYKSYKEQIEDKIENEDIWKDLLSSKKDSKEYKFFAFLMKSIVESNVRLTEY